MASSSLPVRYVTVITRPGSPGTPASVVSLIAGDYVIVGADGHDDGGLADTGAAYIFRKTAGAWSQQAAVGFGRGGERGGATGGGKAPKFLDHLGNCWKPWMFGKAAKFWVKKKGVLSDVWKGRKLHSDFAVVSLASALETLASLQYIARVKRIIQLRNSHILQI